MELSRRELLALGVLGGGAVLLPLERRASAQTMSRLPERFLPPPFSVPFVTPPVLQPMRSDATTDYYQLTLREQATEIIPGYQTRIWGYEGIFPGPTIVARRWRSAVVRQINLLPATHPTLGYAPSVSLHLHGSASMPQFDGYASDVTPRGFYKDYHYPNLQDGRTLWYHDHGAHQTAPNVYSGLAGMYRLADTVEDSFDLPHGEYDVPLIVSDAMFSTTGELFWNDTEEKGVFGDVILVNGRPWPVMQVERRKYRFRILNASISRSYSWRLDSGEPIVVIGTDAGLVPTPQSVKQFRHGVGERYEVIIDFAKYPIGQRVVLQNRGAKNADDYANTNKVLAFDVVREPTTMAGNSIPDVLNASNPTMALDSSTAVATRRLDLVRSNGTWTINKQTWDRVVASGFQSTIANPAADSVEIWEIRNDSGGWHHPMHIHLVDVRILDRVTKLGSPQPAMAHERGPKDVLYIGENERVRVIARFGPHEGRYMVHCHNLVHEDHDMMAQYRVGEGGYDPMSAAPAQPLPAPPW